MRRAYFLAVVLTAFATPALADSGHCDADLKAVDQAMSTAKLNDADLATVKAARAKGEDLHKAGKEEECEKSLAGAQQLLGIAEQHKQ